MPTMTLALMRTLVTVLGDLDLDPLSMLKSFASLLLPLIEKAEAYNKSQNQTLANSITPQLHQSQSQPQPHSGMGLVTSANANMAQSSSLPLQQQQNRPSMETSYNAMNAGTPNMYGINSNWAENWDKWLDFQNDGTIPLDAPDYFFF